MNTIEDSRLMAEQHIRRLEEAYKVRIDLLRAYARAEKNAITALYGYLAEAEIGDFEATLESYIKAEKQQHANAARPWKDIRRASQSS